MSNNHEQAISTLKILLSNLNSTTKSLSKKAETSGQSWGGADVMIISADETTQKQFIRPDTAHVTILSTPHFNELGQLYKIIMQQISKSEKYNSLTKFTFWPEITKVLIEVEKSKTATLNDKVQTALEKTIQLLEQSDQ